MVNRNGFTLLELVCVIAIIALLFAMLMPSLSKVKKISTQVVCGTNLKGLGTAITVYANDYGDAYPELPGEGSWAKELGFDHSMERPGFGKGEAQEFAGRTITASWYLLVREADVSPKSMVCPESSQYSFGGKYSVRSDISELWDFGDEPYKHVSYSMHNPYGDYPAHGRMSASFAVAGDMSPWFVDGDVVGPGADGEAPQLLFDEPSRSSSLGRGKRRINLANSINHGGGGQNVLFADGHNSFEKRSDVGVEHDGIYTYWPKEGKVSEEERRVGVNPTGRDEGNDAKDANDSFLAI